MSNVQNDANYAQYNDGLYGNPGSPIVIFFGQTKSGKTTALVRLIRHLHTMQYTASICKTFHDFYYPPKQPGTTPLQEVLNDFDYNCGCDIDKVKSTAYRYLVDIKPNNAAKAECRFLEAPGEDLFALQGAANVNVLGGAGHSFKYRYLNDIIQTTRYKKIWMFFMDPEFTDELRGSLPAYLNAIQNIPIGGNDNVIFVLNKVDVVTDNPKEAPKLKRGYSHYINANYDSILTKEPFTTETYKWWRFWSQYQKKEHFKVLPFCAYTIETQRATNEEEEHTFVCDPSYPQKLWETIQAAINNEF